MKSFTNIALYANETCILNSVYENKLINEIEDWN